MRIRRLKTDVVRKSANIPLRNRFCHLMRKNPMDIARKDALKLDFGRGLKVEFHGTEVTNDAGSLA